MPIFKDLPGLAERIGAGTADFGDKVADSVRIFACGLWNSFPDQITQNSSLGASFSRGFMNSACADQTLPPPPTSDFEGGQCPGESYRIEYQGLRQNNDGSVSVTGNFVDTIGPIATQAPFSNLVLTYNGVVSTQIFNGKPAIFQMNNGNINVFVDTAVAPMQQALFLFQTKGIGNIKFAREDGGPECGDPPPTYPPTSPTANDYNTTVNINTEDGGVINVPITFSPTLFSFPMNFDLGGVNVRIDIGGISFNFGGRDASDIPLPLPDGQEHPFPAPNDNPNESFNPIPLPPPNTDDFDEDVKDPMDPKEEDVGDELRFVRVTVTGIPANAKEQFGDGAPNVFYCGWFEFQSDSFNFPRRPIHFSQCIFDAPEGATGYAYTLYEGFTGFATVYTLK